MTKNWKRLKTRMIRAYGKGESLRKLAVLVGEWDGTGESSTSTTICKWLSRWGVERRGGTARQRLNVKDLVGERYGRLTVMAQVLGKYPTHWLCSCSCGRRVTLTGGALPRRKSCGCGRNQRSAA